MQKQVDQLKAGCTIFFGGKYRKLLAIHRKSDGVYATLFTEDYPQALIAQNAVVDVKE